MGRSQLMGKQTQPHPVTTELHWPLQAVWSPWFPTEQPFSMALIILQKNQDLALGRENGSKRSRTLPEQLNLCPSPLIKVNYLEGMLKKRNTGMGLALSCWCLFPFLPSLS